MQRCRQMSDIAREGVKFQSESSAGKEYHAFAFRLDEMDFCPCIAFVMARNKEAKRLGLKDKGISAAGLASDCKHLKEIRRVTCQWTQRDEGEYRWDGTCPKCGGPLVEEGRPMIPDGAGTDHVDDLKTLLAELKGAPEPGEVVAEVVAPPSADVAEINARSAMQVRDDLPADPRDWIEAVIEEKGSIPTGDEWVALRERFAPVYGKRKIDAAYKAAGTAAALARMDHVLDPEEQHVQTEHLIEIGRRLAVASDVEAVAAAEPIVPVRDPEKYRCLGCNAEYDTEADMQDCEYSHTTDEGRLVPWSTVEHCVSETLDAVNDVLLDVLAPTLVADIMSRVEQRVHPTAEHDTSTDVEAGPEAAARRLATKIAQ
jgi:hypothetical protein